MTRLHIESLGQGADLLLLHGWGLHGGIWDGVREQLAQKFRLHIVDLPGYGASAHCEPYSVAALAGQVALAMPERAHVCGWSLGGQVAMRLALDFPQRVGKLILLSSTPCFRQRADWMHAMDDATMQEFARSLEQDYVGTLKRFLSLQARSGDDARAVIATLRSKLFERGEPSLHSLRGGLAILHDLDLRPVVGSITQATLLLQGGRDTLTPLGAAEWLAQHLPNNQLRVLDNAAHAPFLSHRLATMDAMEQFLNA